MSRTITTNGTLGATSDSSISTTITSTVTLGSGGYLSPLTITNTGAIDPTNAGATGLVVPEGMTGASIDNQGRVAGATNPPHSGSGGIGVDLESGTLTNGGTIDGGTGGPLVLSGGRPSQVVAFPGAGGAGANVVSGGSLVNDGIITGGTGGIGGTIFYEIRIVKTPGAPGGSGVYLDGGTLTNDGIIIGGTGGTGPGGTGAGGIGVSLNGGMVITSGSITGGSGGGSAVQFGTVAAELIVDPGAVFGGAISGFALGDTIELTGVTENGFNYGGGILTLDETGGGTATLDLPGTFTTTSFNVTNNSGGTEITLAPCFCAGTHLLTVSGEVTVEELQAGDLVVTSSRGPHPVRWIGHRHIECTRHQKPQDVWPVRVRTGAFGINIPHRDLFLSPDHAVFIDGTLIPIRYLVNGSTDRAGAACRGDVPTTSS